MAVSFASRRVAADSLSQIDQSSYGTGLRTSTLAHRFAEWILPNFAVVIFAVALLEVLFLAQGASGLFRDSDAGWHIRNGEAILRNGQIPHVDTFSYTRNGTSWFAWEWLSDVVFGASDRLAGLAGVALLTATVIALAASGSARLSLALGGDLLLTAGSVIVILGVTSIHWLSRPHVFSWVFALLFLAIAEKQRLGYSRALWALPFIACLWANMHGSFLLGPAILFIYAIAGSMRRFAPVCFASLLATFVNPYGWKLHQHVISYLNNDYLMDHIAEFQSFSFHGPGAFYVELLLVASILGIAALIRQRAYAPALLGVALLHMSFYSARHLPLAALLLLPLSVAALTREAGRWPELRSVLAYSERLRLIDKRIWGIAPLAVVLSVTVFSLNVQARAGKVDFDSTKFPVDAVKFLEQQDSTARVFTKDGWGGYLIYRLVDRPVFVDGRSDFYGQKFIETYARVIEVQPGWDSVLEEYDVRYVLVPVKHALASTAALSPRWKQVYSDRVAAVFERIG